MKVTDILIDLSKLDDRQIELFWESLEDGFKDEWDCKNLQEGIEQFRWSDEFRITSRSAIITAEHIEDIESKNKL
jgi:hypothetical protein